VNTRLRRTRGWTLSTAAVVGLALGGALQVWVRSEVQRARYTLARLEVNTRELQQDVERLRREAQMLASPVRIERLARLQGFVHPSPQAWIQVTLRDPAAGARADVRSAR